MSSSNCCFLTCIQISQEGAKVVWYSHIFQNFLQFIVIHTVKSFGIVNKAEIDFFGDLSCFFNDPVDVRNLISGSFAISKTSLNIWKFTVHVLLKPGLENLEHYFTSMWDEYNCAVVWIFFDMLESGQFSSVAQLCLTPCSRMNCSTPGLPVHHQLPAFTQTHVHWVRDAIQPSHPLSSSSPPAPNTSQHQSLFQWVNSHIHTWLLEKP